MKKKGKFSEDEAIVLYAGLEVHDGDCSKVLTDPDFSMPLAGRDVSSLRRKVRSDSRKLHEAQQALHAAQQQQQVFQQSLHEAQLQFGALNLGEKYSFVHQPIVRHPKPQHLEHIQFHDWYHEDGLPHPLVNIKNNQVLEEPPKDFHDNDLQDYLNDLELQRQNAGSGSNGAQLQPAGGVDPSNNEEPLLQASYCIIWHSTATECRKRKREQWGSIAASWRCRSK